MKTIEENYQHICSIRTDIKEHLPVLLQYATGCPNILELGVRGIVSTWAFLAAKPKVLRSVDIVNPGVYGGDLAEVERLALEAGIDFKFIEANDLELSWSEPIDLLFIDTWHIYQQLKCELDLYGDKTRRYIILHDTTTFGERGEGGHPGLQKAIDEFLEQKLESWCLDRKLTNCNGLTILSRR